MSRFLAEPRNNLAEPLGSAEPRLKNTALDYMNFNIMEDISSISNLFSIFFYKFPMKINVLRTFLQMKLFLEPLPVLTNITIYDLAITYKFYNVAKSSKWSKQTKV